MSKNIRINWLRRITADAEVESLEFDTGLNLIIGEPNTGKTVWLKLLDYLLGDAGPIEKALGEDERLLSKYVSVSASLTIGHKPIEIERRWNEKGIKSKIIFDDDILTPEEFSNEILELLEIPVLKIPKGNPYANTWNNLSFRTLLRHFYRQERFWDDVADKQPEADQFACIAQFLGFASKIYSQELTSIVDKNKELIKLESQLEQFERILDNISRDLTSDENEGMISFVTIDEIENTINLIEERLKNLVLSRKQVLEKLVNQKAKDQGISIQQELTEERIKIINKRTTVLNQISSENQKLEEIKSLRFQLDREIGKLERANAATLISDLKITHCPACDQSVEDLPHDDLDSCFLCRQPVQTDESVEDRIKYEIQQLRTELFEIDQLTKQGLGTIVSLNNKLESLSRQLIEVNRKLEPLKSSLSIYDNEEIGLIDLERGKLGEKIENLKRIRRNIKEKKVIAEAIDKLSKEIKTIETTVDQKSIDINYAQIGADFEDAMMDYINQIQKSNPSLWTQGRIKMQINERGVDFYAGDKKWTALSATLKAYFLLAYHYASLVLSNKEHYNFPGLLIIDFPPQFGKKNPEEGESLNYLIEPFYKLTTRKNRKPIQIIIAGRYFESIEDVNIIRFSHVWD